VHCENSGADKRTIRFYGTKEEYFFMVEKQHPIYHACFCTGDKEIDHLYIIYILSIHQASPLLCTSILYLARNIHIAIVEIF
jgi:hypothetical protein